MNYKIDRKLRLLLIHVIQTALICCCDFVINVTQLGIGQVFVICVCVFAKAQMNKNKWI